ncbi:MAG: response regulator, partial [Planctomycetes bacterium]|nr:response regulator [Planctomycetota bacterium]
EVATGIIRQVAKALQAANEQNVVHRGIEPSHIMLSPGGRAKVLGFGLARLCEASDAAITADGALVNVGAYSPPETGEGVQDIRGDIYSLGCVFYQLLTGKVPFTGRDPLELLHHHKTSDYWPVADLVPDLPDAISGVVDAMLEKRLLDRVRDPAELIHLIDAAINPEILGAQGIKPDKTIVMTTRSMLALREKSTVLICDDQEYNLNALRETITGLGLSVLTTRNGKAAIQTMSDRNIDLVVTDTKLPGLWGGSLFKAINDTNRNCKIIITRRGELAEEMFRAGIYNVSALLDRPLDMQAVRDTVQQSLKT